MNCPKCSGFLVKNTYHRAIKGKAKWYCPKCDIHLSPCLRPVVIQCDCGCGWNNSKEIKKFNALQSSKKLFVAKSQ